MGPDQPSCFGLENLWEEIREGAEDDGIREKLAALLEHEGTLRAVVLGCRSGNPAAPLTSSQQVMLLMRILSRHRSWPGTEAVAAELERKLRRPLEWQRLEGLTRQLHDEIRSGRESAAMQAAVADLADSGLCRHAARTIILQFGFSDEEARRELDLPAVVWKALRNLPEWRGLAAFVSYLKLELRADLRSLARAIHEVHRLSDDAADLLGLLRGEHGDELAESGLLEFLSNRIGMIQDLARARLDFSFERTERVARELALKRGNQVQSLDEPACPMPATPAVDLEPDWLQVLMQRLVGEALIPPPPAELVRLMLFTRIQALEEGGWERIWEELSRRHPEHELAPRRWARLFFSVSDKIKRHLKKRNGWAPDDWHRAFRLWLFCDQTE